MSDPLVLQVAQEIPVTIGNLLCLAMAVVFVCWTSTPARQTLKTAEEYNNRGLDRQNRGDLDGAIADYTRALQLESNDASIYFGRGAARQKKNDLEGALADYNKAIELDPSHALAHASPGVVKVLLKKSDYAADFAGACFE